MQLNLMPFGSGYFSIFNQSRRNDSPPSVASPPADVEDPPKEDRRWERGARLIDVPKKRAVHMIHLPKVPMPAKGPGRASGHIGVHLIYSSPALAQRARCAPRNSTRPHDPENEGHLQKLRLVARDCTKKRPPIESKAPRDAPFRAAGFIPPKSPARGGSKPVLLSTFPSPLSRPRGAPYHPIPCVA